MFDFFLTDMILQLFSEMLEAVLHAKMSFFDTTPVGRLINRFSKGTVSKIGMSILFAEHLQTHPVTFYLFSLFFVRYIHYRRTLD
jgi:ABC-type multidrug transport system fused ATPase/permease subunit